MFLKTFLFLFSLVTVSLFAQIRDSVLNDDFPYSKDSTEIVITDTVKSTIDSLVTISEAFSHPLYYQPFSNQSTFIGKTDILRNDYRYTGDFLKIFPFSFERSYGFIGQPNDSYLYAERKSTTSYFMDGAPIRVSDFNHIQSEDIDSIEIVPLPRGFLYGFTTNPVSVNFISKDIIPTKPYSRIKYYEGPFGEAFIDGMFSMHLFKDLIASVDITNRKVDDSYKNSAFSIWQTKAKLRYNLSDDVNLIGSYYFSKSETGINGGVNVDAIRQTNQDITSTLYNETLAPVYYEKNTLNYKQHNFGLKLFAKPFDNAFTDLSFNYNFYQQENIRYLGLNKTIGILKNKSFDVLLHQNWSLSPINLSLQAGYQYWEYKPIYLSDDPFDITHLFFIPYNYNSSFISPLLSFTLFDSLIVPSIYFKQLSISQKQAVTGKKENNSFGGYGIDLFVNLTRQLNFYLGYSDFNNDLRDDKLSVFNVKFNYKADDGVLSFESFNKRHLDANLWGIGFSGSYKIWRILLEGRFSQLLIKSYIITEFLNLPETSFSTGIFYKDSLFNSNLDLKAGFLTKYYGKQYLDFLVIPNKGFESNDVPSSYTIDFTLSAEIQKSAIVYFTWENLFDKKYYITPYYPMLGRNIRFGVAWEIFN